MYLGTDVDPLGHPRLSCHGPWDPEPYWAAVVCPGGFLRDTAESAALTCERGRLPCPAGVACLCRPCVQDMSLKMYPVQVARASLPGGGRENQTQTQTQTQGDRP